MLCECGGKMLCVCGRLENGVVCVLCVMMCVWVCDVMSVCVQSDRIDQNPHTIPFRFGSNWTDLKT